MISHILAPTDFSENAYIAVKAAIEFAEDIDARVTVLHMYDVPSSTGMLVSIEHIIKEDAEADMNKLFDKLNEEKLNMRLVEPKILKDDVAVGVTKYSTRHNVDLIIMGNKGETNLNTIFFGSNTQNLINHARTPVLVIANEEPLQEGKGILFAVESEDQLEKVATFPLLQIAQNYNSPIHFFNVNSPEGDPTKLHIPEEFDPYTTQLVHIDGENVIEEIDNYTQQNDIQIACLIYKKRSWIESFFYGSTLNMKQFAREKINVMVLRER